MRVEDTIFPEHLAGFEQQRATFARTLDGEPQRAEFAYPCPDGVIRYFDVRWSPIVENGERLIAVVDERAGTKYTGKFDKWEKWQDAKDSYDHWALQMRTRLAHLAGR
jgi:hypothetical protein